jgi:hypothetical protein
VTLGEECKLSSVLHPTIPSSLAHIFSSAFCSLIPSIYEYILPFGSETKLHIRIKQEVKIILYVMLLDRRQGNIICRI